MNILRIILGLAVLAGGLITTALMVLDGSTENILQAGAVWCLSICVAMIILWPWGESDE